MPEAPNFDENRKSIFHFIFDLLIENRHVLHCDRVSMRLISGSRVTYDIFLIWMLKGKLLFGTIKQNYKSDAIFPKHIHI